MNYLAPESIEAACRALEQEDAMCLAGGQSLVAMMNLGLASPRRLVSLRRISALRGTTVAADGSLRIGAMTTHAELAAMRPTAAGPLLLARTARVVAYPAIRNRGTLGGSVALADPAADYPVALLACGALVEISSATEKRQVAAKDFFIGLFETALRAGEIVTALTIPSGPRGAGAAYAKLSLVAGDFAIVSVAAIGRAGADVELAVGGCGPVPQRIVTQGPDDAALLTAGRILAAASQPTSDHRASAAYRRRVIPELVRRAGRAALEQAT